MNILNYGVLSVFIVGDCDYLIINWCDKLANIQNIFDFDAVEYKTDMTQICNPISHILNLATNCVWRLFLSVNAVLIVL